MKKTIVTVKLNLGLRPNIATICGCVELRVIFKANIPERKKIYV